MQRMQMQNRYVRKLLQSQRCADTQDLKCSSNTSFGTSMRGQERHTQANTLPSTSAIATIDFYQESCSDATVHPAKRPHPDPRHNAAKTNKHGLNHPNVQYARNRKWLLMKVTSFFPEACEPNTNTYNCHIFFATHEFSVCMMMCHQVSFNLPA